MRRGKPQKFALTVKWSCLICLASALLSPAPIRLGAQDIRVETSDALRVKAAAIRASADSLFKLKRIPWITNPAEGFRLAREEKRPVFFYQQVGDPLEDC